MSDNSTTPPLVPATADTEGLEFAFELPEYLKDEPQYASMYVSIIERLRREANGLPMSTVQQLLLERIASFYTTMKHKENTGGFTHPSQQKEFMAFWLSMTQEFNKILMAGADHRREALMKEIQAIVSNILESITDPDEKRSVRKMLKDQFDAIDV